MNKYAIRFGEYLKEGEGDGSITIYGDVIVKKEGKVLILKRASTSRLEPNKWTFPGGHVMPSETAQEGALRECKEECGVILNNVRFIAEYANEDGESISNYYCGDAINDVDEDAVMTESDAWEWIYPQDFRKYDIIFDNYDRWSELLEKI